MENENLPFKIQLLFWDFQHDIQALIYHCLTSLNCFSHSKIMTAVTSHLFLPGLISEMPPGSAKDIVMQLYGQTDQSASLCLYILHFSFYFMFSASVVVWLAKEFSGTQST